MTRAAPPESALPRLGPGCLAVFEHALDAMLIIDDERRITEGQTPPRARCCKPPAPS